MMGGPPRMMAEGGITPGVSSTSPMDPVSKELLEDQLIHQATESTPKMARGGFVHPIRSAVKLPSPMHMGGGGGHMGGGASSQPLANPVPMARQMMRYRSSGGPMSKVENPMTAGSFPSGIQKGGKKFPMPKSESGSMESTAYN